MFPSAAAPDSTPIFVVAQHRVPTVMENPGKSWKKVVMESHGKVMENRKNSECHGNLFARKKSHGNQLSKSA